LGFELALQAITFERRLFNEVLHGVQRVMTDAWSELDGVQVMNGKRSRSAEHRNRVTRRAA